VFGDDRVVGAILDADDARGARDDNKARWERGMRTCAHNNQTDHVEGGVVGDDDDGDGGDDDNDDNDNDGGCGGQDGHHRMRSGATE
jgi:hypothetical protein